MDIDGAVEIRKACLWHGGTLKAAALNSGGSGSHGHLGLSGGSLVVVRDWALVKSHDGEQGGVVVLLDVVLHLKIRKSIE